MQIFRSLASSRFPFFAAWASWHDPQAAPLETAECRTFASVTASEASPAHC